MIAMSYLLGMEWKDLVDVNHHPNYKYPGHIKLRHSHNEEYIVIINNNIQHILIYRHWFRF